MCVTNHLINQLNMKYLEHYKEKQNILLFKSIYVDVSLNYCHCIYIQCHEITILNVSTDMYQHGHNGGQTAIQDVTIICNRCRISAHLHRSRKQLYGIMKNTFCLYYEC